MRLLAILVASLALAAVVFLLVWYSGGLVGFGAEGYVEAYKGTEGLASALESDRSLTLFGWTALGVALVVAGFLFAVGILTALLLFFGALTVFAAAWQAISILPGSIVFVTLFVAFFCMGIAGYLAMEGKLRFWQQWTASVPRKDVEPVRRVGDRSR